MLLVFMNFQEWDFIRTASCSGQKGPTGLGGVTGSKLKPRKNRILYTSQCWQEMSQRQKWLLSRSFSGQLDSTAFSKSEFLHGLFEDVSVALQLIACNVLMQRTWSHQVIFAHTHHYVLMHPLLDPQLPHSIFYWSSSALQMVLGSAFRMHLSHYILLLDFLLRLSIFILFLFSSLICLSDLSMYVHINIYIHLNVDPVLRETWDLSVFGLFLYHQDLHFYQSSCNCCNFVLQS